MAAGSQAPQDPAGDEARRKFREALDRKRGQAAESGGKGSGPQAEGIHEAHGPAGSRRTFRRKSG